MTAPALSIEDPPPHPALLPWILDHVGWLEATNYSRATVRSRRRNLARFAIWCTGHGISHPADLTLPILESYRRALYESRKLNGDPLGGGDQIQKLLAVKQFLRWAARMRVVECDVGAALEFPRRPQHLPSAVLSTEEVQRVLRAPCVAEGIGIRDRAILETLYSTGIRRMELIGLKLSDLDAEHGVLGVREGKGKKDRFVPIGTRAVTWIRRYCADVRPQLVSSPDPPNLFVSQRGNPMSENRLSELVRRYIKQAGVQKPGSCHLFRHAMATHMLDNGADVRHLQVLLGHAQLSTTAIYTRVSITALKAVHERTHPQCGWPLADL